MISTNPVSIYMFKVNNGNNRTRCEICSKWKIETRERPEWLRSDMFLLLTFFRFYTLFCCSYCWLWATKFLVWTNWFSCPANIYLSKVNNIKIRKKCEKCSTLTIKTVVFIVNFEHISDRFLVFLLLNLNK